MAFAEPADIEAVLGDADGAVDRRHTDVEQRNLDLAASACALAFEESRRMPAARCIRYWAGCIIYMFKFSLYVQV
jgi:hypothetical protein